MEVPNLQEDLALRLTAGTRPIKRQVGHFPLVRA